nr:hypothetical protein [Tanacetum cinerariifolium]
MVNIIPPDHVDDVLVVEPNQHYDVPAVPDPVLVDEDEDPEEEEFKEDKNLKKKKKMIWKLTSRKMRISQRSVWMHPRCYLISNRVNNEADPAFTAAAAQAVADLLLTLTAHITDEIRQNKNNGNNEKPQISSSASTPVEAENWISHIEKIFEVLGYDDQFKARFATYKLEGDAHSWWRAYKQAKGGDAYVATLSWNDFHDIFFLQYFPYSEKERCKREYKSIRQLPEKTSTDFMKRFLRLILNTEFTDVAQVANAARNIKIFCDQLKNEGDNKRDRDGHHMEIGTDMALTDGVVIDRLVTDMVMEVTDMEMVVRRRGMTNIIRFRANIIVFLRSSSQSEYSDSSPLCNLCGKFHPGKAYHMATGACFECGEVGHLAKDCKNVRDALIGKRLSLDLTFPIGFDCGGRAVAFVVVLQDSNVLRPRSERACRWTTAVPFLSELERSHLIH